MQKLRLPLLLNVLFEDPSQPPADGRGRHIRIVILLTLFSANSWQTCSFTNFVLSESAGATGGATLDHPSPQFRQPLPPGIRPGVRFLAQQHPQYRAAQVRTRKM